MARDLLAALILFTRLPFWRLGQVDAERFRHAVAYWPAAGWVTGGVLAGALWLASQVMPLEAAWVVAIAARLLATGCLHEDGLADFCDGFGGGTTRERTLAIMKDSHIGTYGVAGLVVYFLLLSRLGAAIPAATLCAVAFCGDAYAKWCASQIVNVLPYARREEESKVGVAYRRMTVGEFVAGAVAGWLPAALLLPAELWLACVAPPLVFAGLCVWMKRRLGGYTGDCCGAVFLLCELSFYLLSVVLLWR